MRRTCLVFWLFLVLGLCICGCGSKYGNADKMLKSGNYSEATTLLKQAVKENPDNCKAQSKLGYAYLKMGDHKKATAELESVLNKYPNDPLAVYYLGLTLINKGDYGRAIEVLHRYTNESKPVVQREIKRQLTVLEMIESRHLAKEALLAEQNHNLNSPQPGTLAVFPYADLTNDAELRALNKALVSMLITDLSKVKDLTLLERIRLQALVDEIELGRSGLVDKKTAARAGLLIGAEHVVAGNVSRDVRVSSSVGSTSRKQVIGAFSLERKREEFFKLEKNVAYKIIEVLGIKLTSQEVKALRPYHTTNLNAVVFYGKGLDALDKENWEEAKYFFGKALEEDPFFDLAAEGHDSTPDPSTAPVGEIAKQPPMAVAMNVEKAIDRAEAKQDQANSEASPNSFGCFPAQTQVLMADGTLRNIERLKVGDMVQTYVERKEKFAPKTVTKVLSANQNHYYLINGSLKITGSHPLFIQEKEWKKASELQSGDRIHSVAGSVEVESIELVGFNHTSYNFEVADSHNYFVSPNGYDHYLVHNGKCGSQ